MPNWPLSAAVRSVCIRASCCWSIGSPACVAVHLLLSTAAAIGRFAAHLATLRNMSITVTAKLVRGESPVVEAALVKDIGTEFEQSIPAVIETAVGMDPDATIDAELYRALAYVSQVAPTYSLRGGTREILRGMIARGLGLR